MTSSPFWIHCNFCFQMPDKPQRFYISNCGHITCGSCYDRGFLTPKCKVCKTTTKAYLINKDLPEEIRQYFVHIDDHHRKVYQELDMMLAFQSRNTNELLAHKKRQLQDMHNTTALYMEEKETVKALKKKIEALESKQAELASFTNSMNSSFQHQQNFINKYLASNLPGSNTIPSFLNNQSREGLINQSENDVFNIMNASYLSRSLEPSRRVFDNQNGTYNENGIRRMPEAFTPPDTMLLDQSSFNMNRATFAEKVLASSNTMQPSGDIDMVDLSQRRTPSTLRTPYISSLRTPNAPLMKAPGATSTPYQAEVVPETPEMVRNGGFLPSPMIRQSQPLTQSQNAQSYASQRLGNSSASRPPTTDGNMLDPRRNITPAPTTFRPPVSILRTPASSTLRPSVTEPSRQPDIVPETPDMVRNGGHYHTPMNRAPPPAQSQSVGNGGNLHSQKLLSKPRSNVEKMNTTSRSWHGSNQSVLSVKSNLSVPSSLSSHTTTTSSLNQSQRSRTCPHWPKSRCRCNP